MLTVAEAEAAAQMQTTPINVVRMVEDGTVPPGILFGEGRGKTGIRLRAEPFYEWLDSRPAQPATPLAGLERALASAFARAIAEALPLVAAALQGVAPTPADTDAAPKEGARMPRPARPDRLVMSGAEVAEALNIGRTTAYELLAVGRIPGKVPGIRSVRVNVQVFYDWLEGGGTLPPKQRKGGGR